MLNHPLAKAVAQQQTLMTYVRTYTPTPYPLPTPMFNNDSM